MRLLNMYKFVIDLEFIFIDNYDFQLFVYPVVKNEL